MAKDKDKKADKESKKDKGSEKEKAPEHKFGVSDLATALGIEPASARVRLRNAKIAKAGKSYGWDTQKALDEVVKALKDSGGKKSKKDDAGADKGGDDKKSKKDKKKDKKDKKTD